jgi:eukaryotic-like serine/threonine-protein kinase
VPRCSRSCALVHSLHWLPSTMAHAITANADAHLRPASDPANALSRRRGIPDDGLARNSRVSSWKVEGELGRGGMSSVHAVVHTKFGKRAAIKIAHRSVLGAGGMSAKTFWREARIVHAVDHPAVIDVFATGSYDSRPYLVMEKLVGVPLGRRVDDGPPIPRREAIEILLELCDVLRAAHNAGIVHRDLKLDNVFLIDNPDDPSQPKVKLLDWGIAKIISADVRHTIEGQLVGTPQYLSPEQARGGVVSPQSDVYSLGVMAYELFLEQLPFEAETSAEIMAMHLRAVPPPPSEMWPDIPPGLENLLLAMLAKDPESRPTMLTVAHTLELVRSELLRRRDEANESGTAVVVPPTRKSTRIKSTPGFAPTEPAASGEWREPSRRWHVVVGAFALAASALVFMLSRDTETAAASPKATADLSAPAPVAATDSVKPDVAIAQPESLPAAAETVPTQPETSQQAKVTTKRTNHTARKLPVRPRRDASQDPDGTLDPYQ